MLRLQYACRWWSSNLHQQASLRGTHDLGFLIQPWAQRGWELDGDRRCYESLVTAAYGLADRFDPEVACIRSWDTCFTKRYSFADPNKDFLVIIDNMMSESFVFELDVNFMEWVDLRLEQTSISYTSSQTLPTIQVLQISLHVTHLPP